MENPTITLLTDFGLLDPYVGILKGIIADIAPKAKVIDLTHLIPPQNIRAAALALDRSFQYFPPDTIHLAMVDPGVGSKRHAIAMRAGQFLFVGPDNGIFTFVIKRALDSQKQVQTFLLDNPRYRLEPVSPVFHGRDLFAPAAAYLATGAALEDFGPEIQKPIILNFPNPEPTESGWKGEVWLVDHFGSLETNISAGMLLGNDLSRVKILVAGREIVGIVNSYSDGKSGDLIAIVDSAGRLSVSVVNGSAAQILKIGISSPVEAIINE